MQTNHTASKIMQQAINKCRTIYPKGARLVIRFANRQRPVCCKVKSCIGAQYTVEVETSGEIRTFHPEIHLHRFRQEQRDLFPDTNKATPAQPRHLN